MGSILSMFISGLFLRSSKIVYQSAPKKTALRAAENAEMVNHIFAGLRSLS